MCMCKSFPMAIEKYASFHTFLVYTLAFALQIVDYIQHAPLSKTTNLRVTPAELRNSVSTAQPIGCKIYIFAEQANVRRYPTTLTSSIPNYQPNNISNHLISAYHV